MRKNAKLLILILLILLIGSCVASQITLAMVKKQKYQEAKEVTELLSYDINDSVESQLSLPIVTARIMANNTLLLKTLEEEENLSEREMLNTMTTYLTQVKETLGADTAFVISDSSKKYYSYQGLNKILDPKEDEHDVWYSIFVEGRKEYDLDVDVDEVHGGSWTVFVNCRMEDEEGKFLGVCGVGIQMNSLQELIKTFEEEYSVKINMVDETGMVQVDTDSINIDTAYLYSMDYNNRLSGYLYQLDEKQERSSVTKYIDDLGWYLVVQKDNSDIKAFITKLILVQSITTGAMAILMGIVILFPLKKEKTDKA